MVAVYFDEFASLYEFMQLFLHIHGRFFVFFPRDYQRGNVDFLYVLFKPFVNYLYKTRSRRFVKSLVIVRSELRYVEPYLFS